VPAAKRQGGHRHRIELRTFRAVVGVTAAAYALVAAATTPFSAAANLLTGVPIVVVAVLVVIRWPLRPRPLTLAPERSHPWRPWVVLFAVLVAWELVEYTARGSRADHPTESSMLNAVDRQYVLKAIVFFLWLTLGTAIIRHGRRRAVPVHPGSEPGEGAGAGAS